jgi:hypothetical protein
MYIGIWDTSQYAAIVVDALHIWMFPAHMNLESILSFLFILAQRALVDEANVNVHLQNMGPNSTLAQDLAAGFADESPSSRHHMFIKECLN